MAARQGIKRKERSAPAALVTGGAVRVGREICLALARDGYDIALHYHASRKDAEETAAEIRALGRKSEILRADLSRPDQAGKLVEKAAAKFPALSALVNSASIFERHDFLTTTPEIFDRHVAINFAAPFFLTQHFARYCKESKRRGQVVNILDTHVTRNTGAYFIYLLTKKSLRDFTAMAARALGPEIRVNALAPGTVLPGPGESWEDVNQRAARLPLARAASAGDLCRALIHVMAGEYLTGQCLFIDNGEQLL